MNNSNIIMTPHNFSDTGFIANNLSIYDINNGVNASFVGNLTDNAELATNDDQCAFEQPPLTDVRFWIVTVFGTTVSLFSIVENSFFFYLFSTRLVFFVIKILIFN